MPLRHAFLRTRFGRRLLLLFTVCALVPIVAVATLSFRYVTSQLKSQAEDQLAATNKALGMSVLERLLFLDAELESVHPGPQGGLPQLSRVLVDQLAAKLEWLGLYSRRAPDALLATLLGEAVGGGPPLSASQLEDLRGGRTVVTTRMVTDGSAQIFLVHPLAGDPTRYLVARVRHSLLWGDSEQNTLSPRMQLTVLDEYDHALFSTLPDSLILPPQVRWQIDHNAVGEFPLSINEEPYLASYWSIFLKRQFSSGVWTLVLSESRADIFASMAEFRYTFICVALLCLWVVLLLSVNQIRRSLVPLEALQAGTRRIADRQFESRVLVTSGDEFQELAGSFNSMASRLGRQFTALETASEIDRAVLSALDVTQIVETVLVRARDVCPCDMVCVVLPDDQRYLAYVSPGPGEDWEREPVELPAEERERLLASPPILQLESGLALPSYTTPLVQRGARSYVVLPLLFKQDLAGIIVLANSQTPVGHEDDLVQMRRLADQVAVALANVQMIDRVRFLAYYDSLTSLPNRILFKERLQHALAAARRGQHMVAVFFLDLDHFGRINDTLGHEQGDQLVREVGARLLASCRESDSLARPGGEAARPNVARLGGDEFTILIPDLEDPQEAAGIARRLLGSFGQPFRLAGHEVYVTASIGIAIYPFDAEDMQGLLKSADTAMYHAKEQGRNGFQMYSKAMNATALHRLTVENSLRRALEREEFEVHYQPLVELSDGSIVGAEALVRWRHPEMGLMPPAEFIPIAEENGLIVPLGEWIFRSACAQQAAWREAGLGNVRISTNLSSRQLRQINLVERVHAILQETGVEAGYISLELTESILMQHESENVATLNALRSLGLCLSIDDFGTGYSSLSYLKHFPLDTLKIDRSFVRDLSTDPEDALITGAILAMGRSLELTIVAEGVETPDQLAFLRRHRCDQLQGYLFSRPVPADVFQGFLREGKRLALTAGEEQSV